MTSSYKYRMIGLILCILCSVFSSRAQLIPHYTFSQSNNIIYDTLPGASVTIASGAALADEAYPVNLPFDFNFDDSIYSQIHVSVNGYISLGGHPGIGSMMIQSSLNGIRIISPFGANLAGKNTTTKISYHTQGSYPNRTFIIQWKNMGLSYVSALTANFQLHLHESTNDITFAYGSCSLTSGSTNFQVGLRGLNSTIYNSRKSNPSGWSNTVAATSNSDAITYVSFANPPANLRFRYAAPPRCAVPEQLTGLSLTESFTQITLGITPSTPTPEKYLIVRTPASDTLTVLPENGIEYPLNSSIGNGLVVYNGVATSSFINTGLSMNTMYTYTIIPYNDQICLYAPMYNSNAVVRNSIRTLRPQQYYWSPATGSTNASLPANWNPIRKEAHVDDTLIVANGGSITINNFGQQTLNQFRLLNNTQLNLNGGLIIDDTFYIAGGSKLTTSWSVTYLNNANAIGIIDGDLVLRQAAAYNANYSVTEVGGTLIVESSAYVTNNLASAPNNFSFKAGSRYEHNTNGGNLPNAFYHPTSTVEIKAITGLAPTYITPAQFGNFIWNCPNQSATLALNGITHIKGDFIFQSIGNGSPTININPQITALTGEGNLVVEGDFIQQNGNLRFSNYQGLTVKGNTELHSGSLRFYLPNRNVVLKGNLLQGANHMFTDGQFSLFFSGTNIQHINIGGNFSSNNIRVDFYLDNPAGATLTGTLPVRPNSWNTIQQGTWTGSGNFAYESTTSRLIYQKTETHQATNTEWPAISEPPIVIVDIEGSYPNNRFFLPGTRTVKSVFALDSGVVVLNDFNLSITGLSFDAPSYGLNRFIATNGTGKFFRILAFGSRTYTYPIGDITGTVNYTPAVVNVDYGNGFQDQSLGLSVTDAAHPNIGTASGYISRYWSASTAGSNVPFTYKTSFTYAPEDVVGIPFFTLSSWNGASWLDIPSSITGTKLSSLTTYSTTTEPINGKDFTCKSVPSTIYEWNGSQNTDYTIAQNWTPARTNPQPSDVLKFNNGADNLVTNCITQSIAGLSIDNNTLVTLKANAVCDLNIISDSDTSTKELLVGTGSGLKLNSSASLKITFGGLDARAKIAGTITTENVNTTGINQFDFTNVRAKIESGAHFKSEGVISSGAIGYLGSPASLIVAGTYHYNYNTTYAGNSIPNANWEAGSLVYITSPNAGATPNLTGQDLYDLTYDCPYQTNTVYLMANLPNRIRGTFTVNSTGTGSLTLQSGPTVIAYTLEVNKFVQNGGTLDLNSSATNMPTSIFEILVVDSFIQNGGNIVRTGNGGSPTGIRFISTDTVNRQYAFFNQSIPFGRLFFDVASPKGLTLNVGAAMSSFNVDSGATIRISTSAPDPIVTNTVLQYNPDATLAYYAQGDYTADAVVWPETNSPGTVNINISEGRVLTVPFSRTIGRRLTLEGDLDFGAHHLTLGTSTDIPGTLERTNTSNIRFTSGSMTRWIPTSGVPTSSSMSSGGGMFPIAYGTFPRYIDFFFSYYNVVTNGGTIRVAHNYVPGMQSGHYATDNGLSLVLRTNSYWNIQAGNGLALSGTVRFALKGDGLYSPVGNPDHYRITLANNTVGTHFSFLQRLGLSIADISNTNFYLGSAATGFLPTYSTIAGGRWQDSAIWDMGTPPIPGVQATISDGHNVYTDSTAVAGSVFVGNNASLTVQSSTLTVAEQVNTYGTLRMTGGIMNLGPTGGGNKAFNVWDTLDMQGGRLNINGGLSIKGGAAFKQSGGDIYVDGYGSGPYATGTYQGKGFVELMAFPDAYAEATGGKLIIVDPNPLYNCHAIYSNTDNGYWSENHIVQLGDGLSTQTVVAGNTPSGDNGFTLQLSDHSPDAFPLGSLHLKGTAGVQNGRQFNSNQPLILRGDLKASGYGALVHNSSVMFILRNMDMSFGTTFTGSNTSILNFGISSNPIYPTFPQTVGGGGSFAFQNLHIRNNTTAGVTFNIPEINIYGSLQLHDGLMRIGNNKIFHHGGISVSGADKGWVYGGSYARKLLPNTSALEFVYPLGGEDYYAPVVLSGAAGSITGTGDFLEISSVAGDHPALASSYILPNKSLNRYFKVTKAPNLNIANVALNLQAFWNNAETDGGLTASNLLIAKYKNNTWTYPSLITATDTSLKVQGFDTANIVGEFAIGEKNPQPIILQQPSAQIVCAGSNAQFSVHTLNAASDSYLWQIFTAGAWENLGNTGPYSGALSNVLTISGATASLNGNQYRCKISNATDSVFTPSVLLTVSDNATPVVVIENLTNDTICQGAQVQFAASATGAGNTPVYQWKVNGNNAGTNNAVFSSTTLQNNDVVTCMITSSLSCNAGATATSNTIGMTVLPYVTPQLSISADTATEICAGTPVTITATATHTGTNPIYQWKKNGLPVGANTATYTSSGLQNNDTIICVLSSNEQCVLPANTTVQSNALAFVVNPLQTPVVSISSDVGNTICSGTTAVFSAAAQHEGSTPTYQWKKNANNVGTNSATYLDATLQQGDVITCAMTSSATCISGAALVNSNAITINVTQNILPSITIAPDTTGTVCAGSSITFEAAVSNAGNAPVYQWKKNGLNVGTNSNAYTDAGLVTGDLITCELTSNLSCVSAATVNSNTVTMSMTAVTTPAVTILASPGNTICAGTTVTFTPTIQHAGANTSYQWKKNGNVISALPVYTDNAFANGDNIVLEINTNPVCASTNLATSNNINLTVNSLLVPAIAISASSNQICEGTPVTFTAAVQNEGSTPSYQWKKNGNNVGTNSATYLDATLQQGDVITCAMTSSVACISGAALVNSNAITINVTQNVLPSITIAPNTTSTVCAGTTVSFEAAVSNAGNAPVYQWKKNGLNVGTNSNAYTDAGLVTGDLITCELTSNLSCVSAATVNSNTVNMSVTNVVTPAVAILASPGNTICAGTTVTFTPTIQHAGANTNYQWKKNGNVISALPVYTDNAFANGDNIVLEINTDPVCASTNLATSNSINLTVNSLLVPAIAISGSSNQICEGTSVTFTAVVQNEGSTPNYQWKKNGNNVGTNSTSYLDATLQQGDIITCDMTSDLTCVTQNMVTSNSIEMFVKQNSIPSVTITANPGSSIQNGTNVTFTATAVNEGTTPHYQWTKNGTNVGSNVASYSDNTLINNDQISVTLTSSADCPLPATVVSNVIVMNVEGVGIPDKNGASKLTVFPNPAKDELIIKGTLHNASEQIDQIVLQSLSGKDIVQEVIHNKDREVQIRFAFPETISSGLYILKVVFKSGNQQHFKIIINK